MSQFFQIHPTHPQARLVKRAVEIIREGGVIVYPTDTAYALGCQIANKAAQERIERIRQLDKRHPFTLLCRDLSECSNYAKFGNQAFRILKLHLPGPYTFIMKAKKEVPKRLQCAKRKSIGLRVPDHAIAQAILDELGEPLLTTTLLLPNQETTEVDPYEIRDLLEHQVDLIIDGGYGQLTETTIVDFTEDEPVVMREGLGKTDLLSD